MTDRPIIFSAPMVRALLDGRKTQTRRLLKPQPYTVEGVVFTWEGPKSAFLCGPQAIFSNLRDHGAIRYAPGDRLYVREAFVTGFDIDDEFGHPVGDRKVWYRATDSGLSWYDPDTETTLDNPPWKPSIHMPRWASRITLTVTEVRVQRLQEISEADAVAEGIERLKSGRGFYDPTVSKALVHGGHYFRKAAHSYEALWNSLHGPEAWDANPWVVAISFTVRQGNIDQ